MNQLNKITSALGLIASVMATTAGLAAGHEEINPGDLKQQQAEVASRSETAAERAARHAKSLSLGPGSTLEPSGDRPFKIKTGNVYEYQHKFRGVPVYHGRVVVTEDSNGDVRYVNTTPARDLARDITSTATALSPQQALTIAKRAALIGQNANVPTDFEKAEKMIYVDDNGMAHVVFMAGFFVAHPSEPSSPIFFIDANTGEILKQWNGLKHAHATGPGGNQNNRPP